MKNVTKRRWFILLLFFIIYGILVGASLDHAPWEFKDSWRQADTYSVGMDYAAHGIDLLAPRFQYYGPRAKVVQLELMVLPALGALLGGSHPEAVHFRVVAAGFFFLSAVSLFLFVEKKRDQRAAVLSTLLYLILPFSLFYSRAIMPEALVLSGYVSSFYFLLRYREDGGKLSLLLSAITMAFALSQKLTAGFLGIVPVGILWMENPRKFFLRWETYVYGIISLGLPLAYYLKLSPSTGENFVGQIFFKYVLSGGQWGEGFQRILDFLVRGATVPVIILAVGGLLCALIRRDSFSLLWLLGLILSTWPIIGGIQLDYYIILWLPFLAFLAGEFLSFAKWSVASATAYAMIFFLVTSMGLDFFYGKSALDDGLSGTMVLVNRYIPKGAFIATNGESPVVISASMNPGYRLPMNEHSTQRELLDALEEGMEYYVFKKDQYMDPIQMKIIQARGVLVDQNIHAAIFKMEGP
ncbi:MAG: phospholipid carrier-dependent glycosyltransferase [Tissierellia bacterium]|nr:phospholipid carrier-dependent glycosyltransferase [Tissierellia bacterium]